MNRAHEYRHLESEVRKRASGEPNPNHKAGWHNLADAYAKLAEQSETMDEPEYDYGPS